MQIEWQQVDGAGGGFDWPQAAPLQQTQVYAAACRAHGIHVMMGAPNLIRGGSHSGNVAASHITAVHVPGTDTGFTGALVERFPNLSVIDVDAVLTQDLQRHA